MATKQGGKMFGPLRTPMESQVKPLQIPKVAINTTMPGTAPKGVPLQTPNAPNVIKGGSK